jgi:hypothetical protein
MVGATSPDGGSDVLRELLGMVRGIIFALVAGLVGFVPFFLVQFTGSPSISEWSTSQLVGTGLMLVIYFGAAIWIGYAFPRKWFFAAFVAWTTVLHAVTNMQRVEVMQRVDVPAGVIVQQVDTFTLFVILLVPLGVAIGGSFLGRIRRLTRTS